LDLKDIILDHFKKWSFTIGASKRSLWYPTGSLQSYTHCNLVKRLQQLLQALYTHGALPNLNENVHKQLFQYLDVSSRCMLERDDALEQSLRGSCTAAVTCQTNKPERLPGTE
jgi:hypothetical protein